MKEFGTRCNLVLILLALTTMLGCGALNASKPTSQPSSGLVPSAAVLDFGATNVGDSVVRTNTIVNNTRSPIVLTRVQSNQADFKVTGVTLPLTLAPGKRISLQVVYSPQSNGDSQGAVMLASNMILSSTAFTLRGTGIAAGRLKLTPARIGFGNTTVGHTQTQSATLSNAGNNAVTISQVAISGTGFALTGLSVPLTLNPGQSVPLGINFTPASGGAKNAIISLIGTATVSARKKKPGIVTVGWTTTPTTLNVPVSGTAIAAGQVAVSPSSLALGSVKLGTSQTLAATIANSGASSVTVSNATVTGRGFRMSGLSFPLTLPPGQKKSFLVTFTPQAPGTASGTVVIASDAPNSVVNVPVSGMAIAAGALFSNPSSLSFGSVQVGQSQTLGETLTNSGGSNVTVSQASVPAGFVINGLNLPLTLAAGQSTAFSVTYSPQSDGPASGSLSIASDASNSSLGIPLAATGLAAGSLTSSPSSLAFGAVQTGSPKTISEKLTNAGGTSITISAANVSAPAFTVTGLNLPATLAPGQSTTFSVTFTPQGGSSTGSLSVASNATNSTLTIPLIASTATAGVLSTSDSSLDFGSVAINGSATQSETLTNTGGSSVTISQANVSGTGFRVTGLNLPLSLSPGQSFTFGAVFTPTSGGSASGSISVVSDASDSQLTISLAGTASVSGQLAVSPATLNFGSVTVGQSKSLTATLTASGSGVTVSAANMSTSEFTVSGISLPLTLAAGQSKSFTVNFSPQASGIASANASFASNASNSSAVQALTGSGTAAPQHNVALAWNPSTSTVVGYNVYRGITTGGPYAKINSMNADTSYTDSSVEAGQTYFYVTTAVDASGKESANSNQTQATVPSP